MNRLLLAAAAIGLTSLGSAALAQDAGAPGASPDHGAEHGRGPGRPDPFGDATVSRADVLAKAEADFARLDTDHDGFLTADEFSAQFPADSRMRMMAPMMLTRIDTDGDGKVGRGEFTAIALKRFDDADANHDGQLTKAERDAEREAMRGRFRDHGGRHRDHGGDGPPPGDGGPPPGDGGPPPGDGGPPPGDGGPPPGGDGGPPPGGGDDGGMPPPGQ